MNMSLVGAFGAMVVVCGGASAGNLIASHAIVLEGTARAKAIQFDMHLALNEADMPGAPGYLAFATLGFIDFFNGTQAEYVGDLAGAAGVLTNGVDETVYYGGTLPEGGSVVVGSLESASFAGQSGILGPDLTGYVLTDVRVIGTAIQLGIDDAYTATVDFLFFGHRVPTPGAGGALVLAIAGMSRRRR